MRTRTAVLASLATAVAVGFLFTGPLLAENVEGLDASAYPLGPQVQALAEAVRGPLSRPVGGLVVGYGALLVLAVALAPRQSVVSSGLAADRGPERAARRPAAVTVSPDVLACRHRRCVARGAWRERSPGSEISAFDRTRRPG